MGRRTLRAFAVLLGLGFAAVASGCVTYGYGPGHHRPYRGSYSGSYYDYGSYYDWAPRRYARPRTIVVERPVYVRPHRAWRGHRSDRHVWVRDRHHDRRGDGHDDRHRHGDRHRDGDRHRNGKRHR